MNEMNYFKSEKTNDDWRWHATLSFEFRTVYKILSRVYYSIIDRVKWGKQIYFF